MRFSKVCGLGGAASRINWRVPTSALHSGNLGRTLHAVLKKNKDLDCTIVTDILSVHNEELAKVKTQHIKELTQVKTQHMEELIQVKTQHIKELTQIKIQHIEGLADAKARCEKSLSKVEMQMNMFKFNVSMSLTHTLIKNLGTHFRDLHTGGNVPLINCKLNKEKLKSTTSQLEHMFECPLFGPE
eukprot:Colp12_sorted_trinity150504_noHs@17401